MSRMHAYRLTYSYECDVITPESFGPGELKEIALSETPLDQISIEQQVKVSLLKAIPLPSEPNATLSCQLVLSDDQEALVPPNQAKWWRQKEVASTWGSEDESHKQLHLFV